MKREAFLLGIGLLLGCGIGLSVGMRPVPASARTPVAPEAEPPSQPPTETAPGSTTTTGIFPTEAEPIADPRAQLTRLLAAPNPMNQWSEIDGLLTRWSGTEPQAALEFVQRAPRFPLRNAALAIPLTVIARGDPLAVADWLRTNQGETDRQRLADQIVATLADTHPHEAILLATTKDLRTSAHLFGYAIGRLATTAPADALAFYSTLNGPVREHAAQMLAGTWSENDPVAALRWCETLHGDRAENAAATGLLLQLAQADPSQAAAALVRLQPPAEAACAALQSIAQADPALAFGCIAALPAAQASAATKALAECVFGADPDRAAALLRANVPAAELAASLRTAWNNWRDSDRPAAEAWADNLADPELRSRMAEIQLADAAESDPTTLLATLDTISGATAENDAIRSALNNAPTPDAARWIAAHPQLVSRETAAQIARNYAANDSTAAATWARALPDGEFRDRALASVAINSTDDTPALQSADTLAAIGDPQLQLAARFEVFRGLQQQDHAVALAWLDAQPVSTEVRASWEAIVTAGLDSAGNYSGAFGGE
jgi:hypothetical protein